MISKSVLVGLAAAAVLSVTPASAHATASVARPAPPSSSVLADPCTTAPQPPTNVRAFGSFSPNTIIVSWTIVPPPDGCTLAGFDVLRAPGASGGTFVRIRQTPVTTSLTDMQVQPSTTYRYQIQARTTNGLLSTPSATAQATTADACFPQLPFPPALSILAVTTSSVSLAWTAASPACVAFDILRATGAAGTDFTIVGTTTSSRFTDNTVATATTYRYRIRARIITTGMIWGFTNIVTVTTP